jgi:hypothetical protein
LKRCNITKSFGTLTGAAVFSALLFSCAGLPEKAELESSVQLLPDSSNIVISAGVDNNRELIEPVLEALGGSIPGDLAEDFLERTDRVWAGLELPGNSGLPEEQRFVNSISARGSYPRGLIEFGLFFNSGWKKDRFKAIGGIGAGLPYWRELEGNNQIAFPSNDYFLASGGKLDEMLSNWYGGGSFKADAEFLRAEKDSDVLVQTRGLSAEEYAVFVPELKRVPFNSMLLKLRRHDDSYEISGKFELDSGVNAFLISTILRALVITARDEEGKRLFTDLKQIKIAQEGSDVILEGMVLPVEVVVKTEIEWLLLAGIN